MPRSSDAFLRSVGGVLLGYVALAFPILLGTHALYAVFDPDVLFEPGSYRPTVLGLAAQTALFVVSALLGGYVCRRVARSRRPAFLLATVLFLLSLYPMLYVLTLPNGPPIPRAGGESFETIRERAAEQQPVWYAILVPMMLVGGILMGSRWPRR